MYKCIKPDVWTHFDGTQDNKTFLHTIIPTIWVIFVKIIYKWKETKTPKDLIQIYITI